MVVCVSRTKYCAFNALSWLGGRKGIWPVKNKWSGAGMVICLECGADCIWPS